MAARFVIRIRLPIPQPPKPLRNSESGIYLEAWNRGWSRAEKKVVMGGGAQSIWNLPDLHFPAAVQIVDLYHARQHLWDVARRLYPNQPGKQQTWMNLHQMKLLDKGKIEKLVAALHSFRSTSAAYWKNSH